MQRFWLAVVALCLGLTAEAQAPNCNIIHYSRELSSRYVEAIAQDQAGYIYLGTRNDCVATTAMSSAFSKATRVTPAAFHTTASTRLPSVRRTTSGVWRTT